MTYPALDSIPPRGLHFSVGDKVTFGKGKSAVVDIKCPCGTLIVREGRVNRFYETDGVMRGRYKSNADMNLFPEDDLI